MRNPFKTAEFLTQALDPKRFPPALGHELMVAGRSNVGKSSFLNRLTGRRALARISARPGKTAALTFYRVPLWGLLVDLPGFGYAATSHEMRESWRQGIEAYLQERGEHLLAVHLVDGRLEAQPMDQTLLSFFRSAGVSHLVVATKMDKVTKGRRRKHLDTLRAGLGLPEGLPLPFSAPTGDGFPAVLSSILGHFRDTTPTRPPSR
jgi:GTP-binding protein